MVQSHLHHCWNRVPCLGKADLMQFKNDSILQSVNFEILLVGV